MIETNPFENHQYLSLETFRKSGVGVATPVWFAQAGDGTIYITTQANAGKVKRIRNNGRVRIAPSDVRGNLLGDHYDAHARIITDPDEAKRANRHLNRKYGLMYLAFTLPARLRGRKATFLAVNRT